jgi:hypothetical protein
MRVIAGSTLATIALLVAAWRGAMTPVLAVSVGSVAVSGVLLAALVARLGLGEAVVSDLDAALRDEPSVASLPADLRRAQRLVGGALRGDELLHDRLAPYLRQIVAQRLAIHRAIGLADGSSYVSRDLWELIGTDRPSRLSPERLERLLEEVERI